VVRIHYRPPIPYHPPCPPALTTVFTPSKRLLQRLLICVCVLGIVASGLFTTILSAQDEQATLSCPSGQTVILEGSAPAGEALLIYLEERAVGGGSTGPDGRWRLPLQVNERPGSYPIEVRSRATSVIYARFLCVVDLAVDALTLTAESTADQVASPSAGGQSSATPTSTRTGTTQPTSGGTARPTSTTATQTSGGGGGVSPSATSRSSGSTSTATNTSTPTSTLRPGASTFTPTATNTPTPTRRAGSTTPTPTIATNNLVLIAVNFGDEDEGDPEASLGDVSIENRSDFDINMFGWKLVNKDQPQYSYAFPDVDLPKRNRTEEEDYGYLTVYVSEGEDNYADGSLYWDSPTRPWRVGDVVELRDANNKVISTYVVVQE
jgi:hypothetical protein